MYGIAKIDVRGTENHEKISLEGKLGPFLQLSWSLRAEKSVEMRLGTSSWRRKTVKKATWEAQGSQQRAFGRLKRRLIAQASIRYTHIWESGEGVGEGVNPFPKEKGREMRAGILNASTRRVGGLSLLFLLLSLLFLVVVVVVV